jgi:hypothetical protein
MSAILVKFRRGGQHVDPPDACRIRQSPRQSSSSSDDDGLKIRGGTDEAGTSASGAGKGAVSSSGPDKADDSERAKSSEL